MKYCHSMIHQAPWTCFFFHTCYCSHQCQDTMYCIGFHNCPCILVVVFHFLGLFFHIVTILLNFIIRSPTFRSIMAKLLTIVALDLGFVIPGVWVASSTISYRALASLIIVIRIIIAKIPSLSTTMCFISSSTSTSSSRPFPLSLPWLNVFFALW